MDLLGIEGLEAVEQPLQLQRSEEFVVFLSIADILADEPLALHGLVQVGDYRRKISVRNQTLDYKIGQVFAQRNVC